MNWGIYAKITLAMILLSSILMLPSIYCASLYVENFHPGTPGLALFGYVWLAWLILNWTITLPTWIFSVVVTFITKIIIRIYDEVRIFL